MAEGETEKEYDTRKTIEGLRGRFRHLTATLRESAGSPLEASLHFCQEFCQVLVENAGRWKTDEDPLPLLEVYTVAILSFAKATSCLSSECENVPLLLEKLALSCVELLLLLPQHVPVALWEEFQSSMKVAHSLSQETGNTQLRVLSVLAQQGGVWSNATLSSILSSGSPQTEQVHEFLELEGPMLLNMRLKHLIKIDSIEKAAVLAKICSEYPGYEGKGNFKQTYLVCICMTKTQEQLMEEITSIDCKDALDMICNLESEGDEKGALSLCTAFLKRQLLQEEVYCAWCVSNKGFEHSHSHAILKWMMRFCPDRELTLFWSKLLIRLESSADVFLEQSKKMALLCRSVCHILFFIKVIQNEVGEVGLPVCVEMCIQAVKMTTSDHKDSKSTICKTIYCLLPNDLEVKRACQLTEFLLQPTVDSYYSVESLYNEPDQKPEEEGNLPVPNSLRCELLLALKTQWPFDPEFWDWRTLKRNCLALMGEEAAIVSSIDTLNDAEEQEEESVLAKVPEYKDLEDFLLNTTNELNEITDEREKNREAKKLREQGFVSARFRNWRAYMQYCVLCDKEFLGHRIVRHAQKHFKDGMYLCPICADSFESKEVLEPHVASHVKQSCKERLAAMKAARKVSKPVQSAKSPSKNVKVAVQTNISPVKIEPSNGNCTSIDTQVNSTSLANQGQGTSETHLSQDCFCPVQNCSKAFKFFRNLMAHVRCHKDDAEAIRFLEIQKQKVVCQYCRRQFVNVKHLNDHLQMHCGIKPYICIQLDCKASFNSNSELLMHRKTHPEFQARCMFPNCGQIFNEAYLLYDHEAQHYLTYTSQMVNCGKVFYSQSQCLSHQENHGTPDAVNNPPQSNENLQPPPNIQPIPQGTPKKEDKCSAFVRLERINTEAYMKDVAMASASPSKSPLILKEPIPVRVKHSIESMLNSVENQNLEAKEPEKCYTPLTNPAPATVADAKVPPEVPRQHPTIVVEHVENTPVYPVPCTKNHADGLPRDGIDNEVTHVVQKVPPQILSPSQIKAEMPCSSQGYPSSMPAATGNEENMHCCPYKDCTRAYSTNKSLSRHVKKQHPEIFEDWKLAKKYNKVVKITAKKISNMETASPSQSHRSPNPPIPPLCNKPGMQQMDYPMGCSCSPSPCYPGSVDPVPITPMVNPTLYTAWGSPGNSAGLMNSEVSQDWPSSPMNNCFPDVFNVAEYPSRSYPQWQPDPYQTTTPLPTERDHSLAATHSGTMSHVTDSTLMSQYVSSSLMLDNGAQIHNGGQQYGLMQPEVSVDSDDVRKTNSNMTGQAGHNNSISTVENLPDGTYHTSYDQNAEPSLPPKVTVDNPVKCQTEIPETQGVLKATIVVPKAATPEAETPGFDPIDSSVEALLSPQSVITTDIPCEEDPSTVDCEANPSDDKSSDADAPKGKRNRLSKRTKWPAIIKDGKVICRRCFREFTSTKSLGGHLSKRSQCKPLDEVDLTADLPTSFLDFLNDPHVPDTNGAIFNMTNGEFAQESCSLTTLTSPQMIKTEPQNSIIDSSSSNPLPSASTEQPSQTNSDQKEKAPEPTNASQAVPRSEDHLMEISKAFQRLDLIEAAQEKLKKETMALAQHVVIIDSLSDSEKSKTPKEKREEKSREKLPKPFKCDKDDCEYSFMTKEALFKHLSKMHDYTNDMIEELKRAPVKFSPYPCQICPKTFTRTTGLRIHYEKVHRLTKPEMLKLKFGARNRRVFRLSKEDSYSSRTATEANTSRTTRSSLPVSGIKQEPFDIAIETQTDHDDNPTMVTTAYDSAEEVIASEITTVTKLPSPHHYLSDGQNCEMSSSSMPDTAQEEPGEAQANLAPELNEKLGEASPSDKPSSSKTSPTKDEPHKREKPQKKLGLKMGDPDNAFSPYRPYRCVHEGCSAAFTIQQNLILHYRAMHQASLPLTRAEGDAEKPCVISGQESDVKDDEVRCQVKDCSRVFMGITKLVQHYLLLHKFTRDKATAMMSSMNVGTFKCDREECSLPFESVDKYIEHIKNFHKEIAISESGTVDTTFKCEYEGCDCVYTTKSNLLRHLIKKHEYVYDPKSSDGRRTKSIGLFGQGSNGKENFESKYKVKKKNIKKKEVKSMDHWSSFGKPALKSHEEACALCTKKSSLQYPCMIIGCDTVERAERSIFKHYTTHGLTERYIEDHRSQFIFCKKYSRSRFKDANKSEGMSTSSSSEVSEAEESETEGTQPNGPNTEDRIAQDYGKLSTDESSESQTSTVAEGNKKGRPRKPAHPTPACSERMQTLRNRLTVSSSRENSNPGTPSAQEEQCDEGLLPDSYKPLEFEDSFLTFLETSESTQAPKRKLSDRASVELPAKRQHTVRQKSAHRGKFSDELSDCANLVDFRNPLNLKSVNNVKIVVDKTFSDGADLLLKQLQDMRPIVIIKRWFCSGS